jgi:hypothetical protein
MSGTSSSVDSSLSPYSISLVWGGRELVSLVSDDAGCSDVCIPVFRRLDSDFGVCGLLYISCPIW